MGGSIVQVPAQVEYNFIQARAVLTRHGELYEVELSGNGVPSTAVIRMDRQGLNSFLNEVRAALKAHK